MLPTRPGRNRVGNGVEGRAREQQFQGYVGAKLRWSLSAPSLVEGFAGPVLRGPGRHRRRRSGRRRRRRRRRRRERSGGMQGASSTLPSPARAGTSSSSASTAVTAAAIMAPHQDDSALLDRLGEDLAFTLDNKAGLSKVRAVSIPSFLSSVQDLGCFFVFSSRAASKTFCFLCVHLEQHPRPCVFFSSSRASKTLRFLCVQDGARSC